MKLCEVLRLWRKMSDRTLRDVSAEIGVSTATLMRIEKGEDFNGENLGKVLRWMLTK